MIIIELTFDKATKGILLNQEWAVLDDLKTNNDNLQGEKQALLDTIATTNAETVAFEDTVEAKCQLVKAANKALRLAVASAQPLIAKLKGLVSNMDATTVKIKRFS